MKAILITAGGTLLSLMILAYVAFYVDVRSAFASVLVGMAVAIAYETGRMAEKADKAKESGE